jgi:DNA-binding transcriptional ArsR family regulator
MPTAFAVLAEPTRRRILDLLREQPRPVGEIVDALPLSQPGVSKHLRVLREAGLVEARPEAQRRVYAVRAEPLAEVDAWLAPYRTLWADRLDALERHLEESP